VRITVQAHAKTNLHLQILGLRPDGYHEVVTVLQSLALHDTITCETRPGPFELRCDRADVPLDASNLIWRAARAIAAHAGRVDGAGEPVLADTLVTLDKNIPMQAGLGGGSADAAAALLAFARLWDVGVDRPGLHALARRLGADVAFCLEGGTMLAHGRGDELQRLPDLPSHAALIVMPSFGVSTPEAYRWHDERVGTSASVAEAIASWPTTSAGWRPLLPSLFNDFESVIAERFPDVAEAVDALGWAGASWAALSGSGSAIVGLFETMAEAEEATSRFDRRRWHTFVTRTNAA
jgi:4-diphosphocytidyl-2-C-methyl-D-erythritol kinase